MKSSRIKAHLKAAHAYAELSHAKRLKVGAVLVREDRIISVGYNGMPSGMSNICEFKNKVTGFFQTNPQVVHAEMNAIAFAAKSTMSTEGATLVITHSPCFECSKLLIQAGIKEVYYEEQYRDSGPLGFLKSAKVKVERITHDD